MTSPAVTVPSPPVPSSRHDAETCATAARLERTAGLLLRRLRPTRPGDLTRSQASPLVSVRDHGPLSLAALAELEVVQAPTASRAVDLLVRQGLLRRDLDPGDHRRHLIALAPGTAELLDERRGGAVAALAEAIAHLDPAGQAALQAGLPALDALLDLLSDEPAASLDVRAARPSPVG